jgi:hypothetical protein
MQFEYSQDGLTVDMNGKGSNAQVVPNDRPHATVTMSKTAESIRHLRESARHRLVLANHIEAHLVSEIQQLGYEVRGEQLIDATRGLSSARI